MLNRTTFFKDKSDDEDDSDWVIHNFYLKFKHYY